MDRWYVVWMFNGTRHFKGYNYKNTAEIMADKRRAVEGVSEVEMLSVKQFVAKYRK